MITVVYIYNNNNSSDQSYQLVQNERKLIYVSKQTNRSVAFCHIQTS